MPDSALMAWRSLRAASTALVRRNLTLTVEGLEHVPAAGPAIIAARHFHHLYDGCALLATIPRPLHIVVGLDWVRNQAGKTVMTRLCRAAAWPIVLRRDGTAPVDDIEAARLLRRAVRDCVELLRAGRVLLVFPEGYPNIDPGYTPKRDEAAFLPFQPGIVRIASHAASQGIDAPIIPAGFAYERDGKRWRVTLRFGEPLAVTDRAQEAAVLAALEARVRALSSHPEDHASVGRTA